MLEVVYEIKKCERVDPNKLMTMFGLAKGAFYRALIEYANIPNYNTEEMKTYLEAHCPPGQLDNFRNEIISPEFQTLEYTTRARLLRMMLSPSSTHLILYSSPHSYDKNLMDLLIKNCVAITRLDLTHFWMDCNNSEIVDKFIQLLKQLKDSLDAIFLMSCNEKIRRYIMKNCRNLLELKIIYMYKTDETTKKTSIEQTSPNSSLNFKKSENEVKTEENSAVKMVSNAIDTLGLHF